MTQALAKVVRAQADALIERSYELQEEIPLDLHRLNKDVAELALVLARLLEGKPMLRAFGAPGDWGYGTPIGEAVRGALGESAAAPVSEVPQFPTMLRKMWSGSEVQDWINRNWKKA